MPSESFSVVRRPPGPVPVTGVLQAGAAVHDITPSLGIPLSGYGAFQSVPARRLWGRLFATALVIDDGKGERVALVAVDLHAGTRYLAEHVANVVGPDTGLGVDRIFFAGAHTHSGPGHIYGNTLYDGMSAKERGLDRTTAIFLIEGIAEAIRGAVRALRPARVGHGLSLLWGYSTNRSLRAFKNDGTSPARFAATIAGGAPVPGSLSEENLAVDPRLQVIWAEETGGAPIGAFAVFAAHGTAIPARHATLSSDWPGFAARVAQDRVARDRSLWPDGARPRRVPVGVVAGAVGDVDVSLPGLGLPKVVSLQGRALAADVGEAVGEALAAACLRARAAAEGELSIAVRFAEPSPAGAPLSDGRSLAAEPVFGAPAAGGSELGRNFILDPENLSTALSLESRRADFRPDNPHSPKLTVTPALVQAVTGRPAPVLPLRLVTLATRRDRWCLAGLPGEPTTMMAYRLERTLRDLGADQVMVAGMCGDYAGYFTTPKEYERQHYEGASTIWGRATGDFLVDQMREMILRTPTPPAQRAWFEADASFHPPESTHGHATRPALVVNDGRELVGRWRSQPEVLPAFGPDPWIVLEELCDGVFVPLELDGAVVSDQTREILVERELDQGMATWSFRYVLPAPLRDRTVRFVLKAPDFDLRGESPASNAVHVG